MDGAFLKRFDEIVVGAAAHGLNTHFHVVHARGDQKCHVRIGLANRARSSRPLMPGIWRSEITASNRSRRKATRASSPLLAVVQWKAGGAQHYGEELAGWRVRRRRRGRGRRKVADAVSVAPTIVCVQRGKRGVNIGHGESAPKTLTQHPGASFLDKTESEVAKWGSLCVRMNDLALPT